MTNSQKLFCYLTLILLIICSCTTTNISSMKDPLFYGRTFKRVLVIAAYSKTDVLKEFEFAMSYNLKEIGIYAIPNHKVLPPIREYTDEERRNVYRDYNFDSYIIIAPQGYDTKDIYVPTISETKGTANIYGNSVSGKSRTTTYNGGKRTIGATNYTQIKFYDISTGNAIWQGDANTELNQYSGFEDVVYSITSEVAEKLEEDGLIKSK